MKQPVETLKRVALMPFLRMVKKWTDQIYFQLMIKRATPVLIFQMGKVGSTSIYWSLLRQYKGVVLHAHKFSPDHEDPTIRRLYDWVIVKGKPLNVISLTREPIGRNISAFFQNFERDTGGPCSDAIFPIEKLKATFLSNYRHEIPLIWFDDKIRGNFDIDVYAKPFPENGICTYSHNNVRLLVMRLETADDEKAAAIAGFLGLDRFQLYRHNTGNKKDYSSTYITFKNGVKLPHDYVEKMCESKFFKHFYSEEVINQARAKWCER